jgi:hypothetical protein
MAGMAEAMTAWVWTVFLPFGQMVIGVYTSLYLLDNGVNG